MVEKFTKEMLTEIRKIYIGKEKQIRLMLASVLCGGHVLLDDLPGSGKTTLVKTMSRALGCEYHRIQFTPDLLPSDVIGNTVFDQQSGSFRQIKGPVFTNILLADEINRAIPRTQSALLEAMEEGQVTIDDQTLQLPSPFLVLATQNPVEQESTFRLPAAQLDRFFMKLSLGFPSKEEEEKMLEMLGDETDFECVNAVSSPQKLLLLKEEVKKVSVSENMRSYIVDLVQATRQRSSFEAGASPRSSRSLYQVSKAIAAMSGRDYVLPEDVQDVVIPVMAHRVQLSDEAYYEGKTAESELQAILDSVPVPPAKEKMIHEAEGK
jgi:MoxR-like ATPase